MDTLSHSFNTAASGTGAPTAIDWLIVWAAVIGDNDREARRKAWRMECKRQRKRGIDPPPGPKP